MILGIQAYKYIHQLHDDTWHHADNDNFLYSINHKYLQDTYSRSYFHDNLSKVTPKDGFFNENTIYYNQATTLVK